MSSCPLLRCLVYPMLLRLLDPDPYPYPRRGLYRLVALVCDAVTGRLERHRAPPFSRVLDEASVVAAPSKPSGSETGSSTGTRGVGPGMLDTDTGITAAGWRYKLPMPKVRARPRLTIEGATASSTAESPSCRSEAEVTAEPPLSTGLSYFQVGATTRTTRDQAVIVDVVVFSDSCADAPADPPVAPVIETPSEPIADVLEPAVEAGDQPPAAAVLEDACQEEAAEEGEDIEMMRRGDLPVLVNKTTGFPAGVAPLVRDPGTKRI